MELLLVINIVAGALLAVGIGRLVWLYRSSPSQTRRDEGVAQSPAMTGVMEERTTAQYEKVRPATSAERAGSIDVVEQPVPAPPVRTKTQAASAKASQEARTGAAAKQE